MAVCTEMRSPVMSRAASRLRCALPPRVRSRAHSRRSRRDPSEASVVSVRDDLVQWEMLSQVGSHAHRCRRVSANGCDGPRAAGTSPDQRSTPCLVMNGARPESIAPARSSCEALPTEPPRRLEGSEPFGRGLDTERGSLDQDTRREGVLVLAPEGEVRSRTGRDQRLRLVRGVWGDSPAHSLR